MLQPVTLHTGRVVYKGLAPQTPEYRGRLLGKRSMFARLGAPPASCLQSGNYFLDMYFNGTDGNKPVYGCCTGAAWMEILNLAYGIAVPESVAMTAFKAARLLNGANILDVLNFAETYPITVNGIPYVFGPSATVDYSDPTAIKNGIATYKAVYWGIDASFLEKCVGDTSGWVAPIITRPLTNYDHAVFSPDYATLDQLATYINQQRGVTVTIGSLDPQMLCVSLDTWDTLGIVPMQSASGQPLTICNTTGEGHVVESFPSAPTGPQQSAPAVADSFTHPDSNADSARPARPSHAEGPGNRPCPRTAARDGPGRR